MRGDLRLGIGLGSQKLCTHLIKAGVVLKKSSCHLRLACKAAEINDRSGMRDCLSADSAGISCSVGSGSSAMGDFVCTIVLWRCGIITNGFLINVPGGNLGRGIRYGCRHIAALNIVVISNDVSLDHLY